MITTLDLLEKAKLLRQEKRSVVSRVEEGEEEEEAESTKTFQGNETIMYNTITADICKNPQNVQYLEQTTEFRCKLCDLTIGLW